VIQLPPADARRSDDGDWWWDGEQWHPMTVAIVCEECGAGVALPPKATDYACSGCGMVHFLRHCPACKRIVTVGRSLTGGIVRCNWCGKQFPWRSWQKLPATAEEASGVTGGSQATVVDADRRIITGQVVAASGFPPLGRGGECRLELATDNAYVYSVVGDQRYELVAVVPYAEARALRVAGRGAATSTRGGGWIGGGFGVGGIAEGALIAGALNALSKRTTTAIETIIHFNAGGRELMMLNDQVTPEVLQVRLAPVFARLDAAHHLTAPTRGEVPRDDPVLRMEQLTSLRDKGLLSPNEFEAAKAAVLRSITG
jgi:hypothetical protein